MLTGDKIETATSIAISSGLKTKRNRLYFLREITDPTEILDAEEELSKQIKNTVVIIDGKTLNTILQHQQACDTFFYLAIQAPCVLVCRCSPTQKADVCKSLKHYTNGKRIAGIGDGGNDVSMILESDVGIGIEGKEGMQASLAADFSLKEFG